MQQITQYIGIMQQITQYIGTKCHNLNSISQLESCAEALETLSTLCNSFRTKGLPVA